MYVVKLHSIIVRAHPAVVPLAKCTPCQTWWFINLKHINAGENGRQVADFYTVLQNAMGRSGPGDARAGEVAGSGLPGGRISSKTQQNIGRPGSLAVQVWVVEQILDTTGGMVAGLPRRILN